jgi:hypothetical protein
MNGLKIGQLTASMTGSLVTIASNPAAQAFIPDLLK